MYPKLPKVFLNKDSLKHGILPEYVIMIENIYQYMNKLGGNFDFFKRKLKHHAENISIHALMRGDKSIDRKSLSMADKIYADFANISYTLPEKRPKQYVSYNYDNLSDLETSIYRNDDNKHVIISHRGTKNQDDVLTDLRLFMLNNKSEIDRFNRSDKKFNKS